MSNWSVSRRLIFFMGAVRSSKANSGAAFIEDQFQKCDFKSAKSAAGLAARKRRPMELNYNNFCQPFRDSWPFKGRGLLQPSNWTKIGGGIGGAETAARSTTDLAIFGKNIHIFL